MPTTNDPLRLRTGITLEMAIQIAADILTYVKPGDPPDEHDSLKLLIQAAKREMTNRSNPDYVMVGPLPGERLD